MRLAARPTTPKPTSESVEGMMSVVTRGRSTKSHRGLSWFWFKKPMGGRTIPPRSVSPALKRTSTIRSSLFSVVVHTAWERCTVGPDMARAGQRAPSGFPRNRQSEVRRRVRPWQRPADAPTLRDGALKLTGSEATDPGSSASGYPTSMARPPGIRLSSSAPDPDGSLPGRAAPP